ncbi:hemerythrin domain-containing protein [Fulvivirga sp. M361]|uniref:hemerythrin domain-containing protein n=1 Tax=Fulvivirga sp. M361 TaxID=2594266 RepID=UPI00162A4ACB|nr:hemerythrin domain-containing protein [Fulvivirga sp. M361]
MVKKNAPAIQGYPTLLEDKTAYAFDFYNEKLKKHFEVEQQILFPQIAGKDQALDELIREMVQERVHLDNLFMKLQSRNVSEKQLNHLGNTLEKHIRKEERIFFQKIQQVFTSEELDQLKL